MSRPVRPSLERDAIILGRMCALWLASKNDVTSRFKAEVEAAKIISSDELLVIAEKYPPEERKGEAIKFIQRRMGKIIRIASDRSVENRLGRDLRAAMRKGVCEVDGSLPIIIHACAKGWRRLKVPMMKLDRVTTGVKKVAPTPQPEKENKAA